MQWAGSQNHGKENASLRALALIPGPRANSPNPNNPEGGGLHDSGEDHGACVPCLMHFGKTGASMTRTWFWGIVQCICNKEP